MFKLSKICFLAFTLFGCIDIHAQLTGGTGKGQESVRTAKPEETLKTLSDGDVDLFSGIYQQNIKLGTVSTTTGTSFTLSLNYASSGVTSKIQSKDGTIPYGEGWSLNLPSIRFVTDTPSKKYTEFDLKNKNDVYKTAFINRSFDSSAILNPSAGQITYTRDDLLQEMVCNITNIELSIPGVYSGRMVFKYINDNDLVFVPKNFDKYFELIFKASKNNGANSLGMNAIVRLNDGTIYEFNGLKWHYVNPPNILVNGPKMAGTEGLSMVPVLVYDGLFISRIFNPHLSETEMIQFKYSAKGKFNHYAEFAQLTSNPQDYSSYNESILDEIIVTDGFREPMLIQRLKLNYKLHPNSPISSIPTGTFEYLDDMYISKNIFTSGYPYKPLGQNSSITNWQTWNIYKHATETIYNSGWWDNFQTNWKQDNPYVFTKGSAQQEILTNKSNANLLNHSYIEKTNIPNSLFKPGYLYQIKTKIVDNPSFCNGALIDYELSFSNYESEHIKNIDEYNTEPYNPIIQVAGDKRKGTIFSTFNRPFKWYDDMNVSVNYLSSSDFSDFTTNYFVMPDLREGNEFNIPKLILKIGPANSDQLLDVPPCPSTYKFPNAWPGATTSQFYNKLYHASTNGASQLKCQKYCEPCLYNTISPEFGLGFPWDMSKHLYPFDQILSKCSRMGKLYNLTHFKQTGNSCLTRPHIPTNVQEVEINSVQIQEIDKLPLMLSEVRLYDYRSSTRLFDANGTGVLGIGDNFYGSFVHEDSNLVSLKKFNYSAGTIKNNYNLAQFTANSGYDVTKYLLTNITSKSINSSDVISEFFGYEIGTAANYISSNDVAWTNNYNARIYRLNSISNNLGLNKKIIYKNEANFYQVRRDVEQFSFIVQSIELSPNLTSVSNSDKKITNYEFKNYLRPSICYDIRRAGYDTVKVFHPVDPVSGKGKSTEYNYYFCSGCILAHPCHSSTITNGLTFGKLKTVTNFDENSQPIKKVDYSYTSKKAYINGIKRGDNYTYCTYKDISDEPFDETKKLPVYSFYDYFNSQGRPIPIIFSPQDDAYFVAKQKMTTTDYIKNKIGSTSQTESVEEYEYYDADYKGAYTNGGQRIVDINQNLQGNYYIDPNWNLYKTTSYSLQNPKSKITQENFYLYNFLNSSSPCCFGCLDLIEGYYTFYTPSDIYKILVFKYGLKDLLSEVRTSYITKIGDNFDTIRKSKYFKYELAYKDFEIAFKNNENYEDEDVYDSTLFKTKCPSIISVSDPINDDSIKKKRLKDIGCSFVYQPHFKPLGKNGEVIGLNGEKFADWDVNKVYKERNLGCFIRKYDFNLNLWTICPCLYFDNKALITSWAILKGNVNFIGLGDVVSKKSTIPLVGAANPQGGFGTTEVTSGRTIEKIQGSTSYIPLKDLYNTQSSFSMLKERDMEGLHTGSIRFSPNAIDENYVNSTLENYKQLNRVAYLEIPSLNKLITINDNLLTDPSSFNSVDKPYYLSNENYNDALLGRANLFAKYQPENIVPIENFLESISTEELTDLISPPNDDDDPDRNYPIEYMYRILFKSEHEKIDDIVINKTGGIDDVDNEYQISRPFITNNPGLDHYFPFHTIKNREILSRNNFLQTDVEIDGKGLKTKYYYGDYYFQDICNNRICYDNHGNAYNQGGTCYLGLTYEGLFLPSRITSGFERPDSVGINLYYTKNASLAYTISDQDARIDYIYDGFNRLTKTIKDGQVLNLYKYNMWDLNAASAIPTITNQNFIETRTRVNKTTDDGIISRSFIDPFGKKAGVIMTPTSDVYTTASSYPDAIMSGEQELDWEDKVLKQYKPFTVSSGLVVNKNTTTTGSPQEFQAFTYDAKSQPEKTYDFGIMPPSTNYSESKTTLATGSELQSEINLNTLEQYLTRWESNDNYLRSESRDADNKKTISYSHLNGKILAGAVDMGTGNPPLVTIYAYDGKWDLKKVIDPAKLETDYKTNLQGLVFEKTTPDQGLTNYFYDEVGSLVAMQDRKLWTENGMRIRLFTYDHFGRMLLQLKGDLDMNLLCPNCNFKPTGGGGLDGGGTSNYRPTNPIALVYNLRARSTDISYPPSNNPVIKNSYGRSYYWLPNQNILNDSLDGSHCIFDSLKNIGIEKLWVYNDLSLDYINTTSRSPNQNNVYTTNLNAIITKLPLPIRSSIATKNLKSLGKLSATASYDHNATLNEIITTVYNDDELPEEEYHYAKFLTYNPKHFLIEYKDYNLAGKVGESILHKYDPSTGAKTHIYGQKMTYTTLGHLENLKYNLAGGIYVDAADYTYDLASGKLIEQYTHIVSGKVRTLYNYDLRQRLTEIDDPYFKEKLFYDASFPTGISGTANYNGNINATQTQFFNACGIPSHFTSTPLKSLYTYDAANRLKTFVSDAYIGTSPTFGNQAYTYSPNGNLTHYNTVELLSTGTSTAIKDHYFHYEVATNKLMAIASTGAGTVTGTTYTSNNRGFLYDPNGNMKTDQYRSTVLNYDRANQPISITKYILSPSSSTTYHLGYGIADNRIFKGTMSQAYYYLGSHGIYDINADKWEHYPGGVLRLKNGDIQKIVKDHLSNTRAIVGDNSSCFGVITAYDYYPFGKVLRKHENPVSRFQSTDNEKDAETGYDDRNARLYDDEAFRFMQVDPLSDAYPSHSPYHYVNNNPITLTDPTGLSWFKNDETGATIWNESTDKTYSRDRMEYKNIGETMSSSRVSSGYRWDYTGNSDGTFSVVGTNLSEKAANLMCSNVMSEMGNLSFGKNEMLVPWDGDRGFWGNLSNSTDPVEQLAYGIPNDFYLTLQTFDFNNFGYDYTNPFNGSRAYTNLDGTPQYDITDRAFSVATTVAPFLTEVKFSKPLSLATRNAGQYNSLFKGTLITTLTSDIRGSIYKSLNWGIKRANSMFSWINDPFNQIDMIQAGQAAQKAKE